MPGPRSADRRLDTLLTLTRPRLATFQGTICATSISIPYRHILRSQSGTNLAHSSSQGMPPEADGGRQRTQDHQATIASVLALEDFDRFVFVMSVLERYPDKECSDLLGCSEQDVREARMRALQQIAEYTKHEVTESKLSEEMQHG